MSAAGTGQSEGGEFEEEVIELRHDLRNPLGHIMGFAELLRDAASQRGYTESVPGLMVIEKESERLIALINSTLDAGMLEAERSDLGRLIEASRKFCGEVSVAIGGLEGHARGRGDEHFMTDLARMRDSAVRLLSLSDGRLEALRMALAARSRSGAIRRVERLASGAVLVADCTELIRVGDALAPGEVLEQLQALQAGFDQLCGERQLRGGVRFGGFYTVGVSEEGRGGLERLAELAILMCREGTSGKSDRPVIRVGLAVGELLIDQEGDGIWGEALRRSLLLAAEADVGTVAVDGGCVEGLRDRFVCENRGESIVLVSERGC